MASAPTSIRLSPAEKRRIAVAARRRGLTPAAYIKRAALAGPGRSDDAKLARLEKLAASLLEAVEDERDARLADARWEKHLKQKTRLYTGEEVWRELGLPA
jgi:predicted DNA-binding protein